MRPAGTAGRAAVSLRMQRLGDIGVAGPRCRALYFAFLLSCVGVEAVRLPIPRYWAAVIPRAAGRPGPLMMSRVALQGQVVDRWPLAAENGRLPPDGCGDGSRRSAGLPRLGVVFLVATKLLRFGRGARAHGWGL